MKNRLLGMWNFIKKDANTHYIILAVGLAILGVLRLQGLIDVAPFRAFGYLMIVAIVILGFYILLGYAGLASLGTAGFIGLGSYITGYFIRDMHWPVFAVLLLVMAVAIVVGLLIGFISLRIEGMYLAIITLALSEILVSIFKNWTAFTGGMTGFQMSTPTVLFGLIELNRENVFFIIVVFFLLALVLTKNITKSPIGRAMLAMKNSESAAQTMGVGLLKYRLLAFVLTTFFSMVAGFLFMLFYRNSTVYSWTLGLSLNILAAVVIGGTRSIWGVLIGAFLIFGLNDLVYQEIAFFQEIPDAVLFINGIIMILVVMFYPGGIAQLLFELKLKFRPKFDAWHAAAKAHKAARLAKMDRKERP